MARLIMTVEQMQDRQAWLKLRNSGLGGSDAAIIAGISKWKSPLKLWAEKTGALEPDDLSNNIRVKLGQMLEPVVADWFCEETGKQVRRRGMMQSCDYPWMLASVDREVVGEKAGLEIKTAGVDQARKWLNDEVPDDYYVQCQWYMAVTGYDYWYIAVLIGGNDPKWKVIERNQAEIDDLIRAGQQFWDLVQTKTPPPPDGSESAGKALTAMYPGGKPETLVLNQPELIVAYERYLHFKEAKEVAEKAMNQYKQQICAAMGNYEAAEISGNKITWKVINGKTTIDTKKLKSELPDIYEKYKKVGNPTRKFDTSKSIKEVM
jgi:putative phage-type endonuclease